jgi:hypothetical protein
VVVRGVGLMMVQRTMVIRSLRMKNLNLKKKKKIVIMSKACRGIIKKYLNFLINY